MNELKRIEREQKLDLLRSSVIELDQTLILDLVEQGYADGAKQAVIDNDWAWALCNLANLEDHLKNKLDKVHKITVEVKREARRKK